jgi:uncharacterized protein YukE
MVDAYYAKYSGLSHEQLYQQLEAGDPDQVDAVAAKFSSLRSTAESVRTSLYNDLKTLAQSWDSESGTEFQRRLDLVGSFAHGLHNEFDTMHGTLTQWSTLLRTARKQAENPAATDNNNNLVKDAAAGAAVGAAVGGAPGAVVGGVIGGIFGHSADDAEKEKAHQRMIKLVAGLAADYVTYNQLPPTAVKPPPDLPGHEPTGSFSAQAGPSVGSPHGVGATGSAHMPNNVSAGTTGPVHTVPATGGGNPTGVGAGGAGQGTPGTSLLGVGDPLLGAGSGGPGGLTGGMGVGNPGAGAGGLGSGMGFAPTAEIAGAAGMAGGAGQGTFPGSGSNPNETLAANRAAAGRGGAVGHGSGDDEPDEHLTWLTEDEMVWGNDQPSAPGVLGAPTATSEA